MEGEKINQINGIMAEIEDKIPNGKFNDAVKLSNQIIAMLSKDEREITSGFNDLVKLLKENNTIGAKNKLSSIKMNIPSGENTV